MKIMTVSFFIVLIALSITIPEEVFAGGDGCDPNTECMTLDRERPSPSGDYFTIVTYKTTKLAPGRSTNVVIGTAPDAGTAGAKLYVTGNARVSGKIRASSGLDLPKSKTDSHGEGALWLKTI